MRNALIFILLATTLTACTKENIIPLDVPDGWSTEGIKWWRTDADTSGMFRNLETLVDMGIAGSGATGPGIQVGRQQMRAARRRLVNLVKASLLPLYRNQPEVVDSLFEKLVVPKMASARLTGDVRPVVKTFKLEGYRTLSRRFREPYTKTRLGRDVPVPMPDSLRGRSWGKVFLQVFVSKEGNPITITLLDGVHPVLDRIAMRAATQLLWQPAHVLKVGSSRPIDAWYRFKINFGGAK